ncbi:hypothetical protein MKEN_01149500 [Mycena kentingensis (nom. inval.)]|nr:hypothetical protein MKEN_01149500 [Mycena kentingensis (nom. inval.)]
MAMDGQAYVPHWGTPASTLAPMTPPHTNAVEPRRLWVPAAPHAYSVSKQSQLLTPPDDEDARPHPQQPPMYSLPHTHAKSHSLSYPPPQPTTLTATALAYPPPRYPYNPGVPSHPPVASSSTSHPPHPHSRQQRASEDDEMAVSESRRTEQDVAKKMEPLEQDTTSWARDWLRVVRTRPESAALVAEKTCEMICYLWFAPAAATSAPQSASSPPVSPVASPTQTPTPSPLQLVPSTQFVMFTQKLLETTQLSQSAIVLALHFIHRLRARNRGIPAQAGSEFRVCVAGLMMANKFLDDNTYTNSTWASVSSIPLAQINTMEREFLAGCDYTLYVSAKVYEDWGRLLRGLVGARARERERERERGRRHHGFQHRGGRLHLPHHPPSSLYSAPRRPGPTGPPAYSSWIHATPSRAHSSSRYPRDRSASPSPRGHVRRRSGNEMEVDGAQRERGRPRSHERVDVEMERGREQERAERERELEVGTKRRAAAAFSPPSYHPRIVGGAQSSVYGTNPANSTHPQRPAPTLVIPPSAAAQTTSFAYPRSAGATHGGWSPVDAPAPPSTTSSGSATSSGYPVPLAKPNYPRVSLATPLEQFGAMSLSNASRSRGPTPSPPRRRLRERPVSYHSGGTAGLTAFAERYGSYQTPPQAQNQMQPEAGRERSTGSLAGRAVSAFPSSSPNPSPYNSNAAPSATNVASYVPPPPSTTVQYPSRDTQASLPSIAAAYGSPVGYEQPHHTYTGPSTLAARWDYSNGAKAPSAQDLYFYALASSPISDASSVSMSDSQDGDEEEEEGEGELEGDDDSGMSDDGRGTQEAYRGPVRVRGRSRALSDARERDPERYREEARRARLRYAPAPVPTITAPTYSGPVPSNAHLPAPQPQHPHHASLLGRWGVQSARTSPVRGPAPQTTTFAGMDMHPPTEWTLTPPRASYADESVAGGGWTPPRVALPRFADLERWSGVHSGQPQQQQQPLPPPPAPLEPQPQPSRKTHHPQPRRAVFANAGPPGVSGYAYVY